MPDEATATETEVWFTIATNFYNYSVSVGATNILPPTATDTIVTLQRKIGRYMSRLANM